MTNLKIPNALQIRLPDELNTKYNAMCARYNLQRSQLGLLLISHSLNSLERISNALAASLDEAFENLPGNEPDEERTNSQ